MLKERDFRQLLTAVRDLNQPYSLDEFRCEARRIASQLVEGERACFSEINPQTGHLVLGLLEPVSVQELDQLFPLLKQHLHENPLLQHFEVQPDSAPSRISDHLSQSQWQNTALYNEVYRHIQTREQTFVGVKVKRNLMLSITIHRTHCTFSDRDCALLDAFRPHLAQAYCNAVARSRMQDEMALPGAAWNSLPSGILIVSQGRLIFCNAAGYALLQSYFGQRKRQNALPPEINDWLQEQNETPLIPVAPLCVRRANRTLMARRMTDSVTGHEGGVLVLLEEEVQHSPLDLLKTLGLTPRQCEVLLLLLRGQTNRQIAAQLVVSHCTVKRHVEAIYDKLQVSTRNAAAQRAHQTLAMHHAPAPNAPATTFSLPPFSLKNRANGP